MIDIMEKTTRYAEIPQIRKGVAFSDPSYDSSVWCCYQKEFNPSSGWVMRLETTRDEEGVVEFTLSLGRRTTMSGLSLTDDDGEGASFRYYKHQSIEDREIGIDSACVFVGSLQNFEDFGDAASIYTASDGLFGDLYIISCKGEEEPSGFLLVGGIDGDITGEDELFRTIVAGFDGHEIDQERFERLTDPNDIEIRKGLAKEIRLADIFERSGKAQPTKGKDKDAPER